MTLLDKTITSYVNGRLHFKVNSPEDKKARTAAMIEKTFALIPDEALDLFWSGHRDVAIEVLPDLRVPFGMSVGVFGSPAQRKYVITMYDEQQDLPADLFIGTLLRQLGHVAGKYPPEEDWPQSRGDRARFKEHLENLADATVWRWGLRHYSMRYLTATFQEHWVDRIVKDVSHILLNDTPTLH